MIGIAFIFAVVLGLTHYYSEDFCLRCKALGGLPKIISLFGGIAVTYLLLDLLPLFSEQVVEINKLLFLSLLVGFVTFHIIEKITYQRAPKNKLRAEIALEQSIALFVYHFLVGIAFVGFVELGLFRATLFFTPIVLYTSISAFITKPTKYQSLRILFASAPLIGVIFSTSIYTTMSAVTNLALLGFVIGSLFYIIMRHSIPTGKEGRPEYFLLGSVFYTILILASWFL